MSEENITYARGRVVELNEEIERLQHQIKPIHKSISLLVNADSIEVQEVKALLDDYETKKVKISDAFKTLYAIQDRWGLR
ncbi:MAG: hypothetical protein U9N42_07705 [Campylobacterota bacterium]|nr:hypothetical protein [Campylobacterota bacterium]